MRFFFAKSKRAGIICIIAAILAAALTLIFCYYAIGNIKCAEDAPILISENGNGIFIGYYLLAAAYTVLCVVSVAFCILLAANAVKALTSSKRKKS